MHWGAVQERQWSIIGLFVVAAVAAVAYFIYTKDLGPGAYVDIRDPKNAKIFVIGPDNRRTTVVGTLSPLTWYGFICVSDLTCASIIVETQGCWKMVFNKFKAGIYCISCREPNITRKVFSKECPLQDQNLAREWASYSWEILD